MPTYKFSGHGNYSNCFGWDDGLYARLEYQIEFGSFDTLFQCWRDVEQFAGASYNVANTFETPHGRLFFYLNEHGGSRSVHGEVCAVSEKLAKNVLNAFAETFQVVKYEPDDRY